jgi:hypothetical protein
MGMSVVVLIFASIEERGSRTVDASVGGVGASMVKLSVMV